jgi:hypothetical protein
MRKKRKPKPKHEWEKKNHNSHRSFNWCQTNVGWQICGRKPISMSARWTRLWLSKCSNVIGQSQNDLSNANVGLEHGKSWVFDFYMGLSVWQSCISLCFIQESVAKSLTGDQWSTLHLESGQVPSRKHYELFTKTTFKYILSSVAISRPHLDATESAVNSQPSHSAFWPHFPMF